MVIRAGRFFDLIVMAGMVHEVKGTTFQMAEVAFLAESGDRLWTGPTLISRAFQSNVTQARTLSLSA